MIKKIIILSFFLLSISSQVLVSANESTGYLKSLFVNQDGLVLFKLNASVKFRPKCANNSDWDYKIELKDKYSYALLDMLHLALSASKPIKVGYGVEAKCGKGFPAVQVHYLYFEQLDSVNQQNKGNYLTK